MQHKIPKFATLLGSLSLCALASNTSNAAQTTKNQKSTKRPNIIFILTDDQPYELLGCNGHPIVETPNLDRLAQNGVLFHNAHVSSAISKPSRTCMLTGQYERRHGVNFNSGTALSAEAWADSYPVQLRNNGYYTGYVGKNHTPIGEKGYDTGLMEKSYDYWYGGHEHLTFYPKNAHAIFKQAKSNTQVEVIQEGVDDFLNPNDRSLEGAISFLDARPEDKPFFLNVCFNLPHGAGVRSMKMLDTDPELYRTKYRDIEIPLPEHYVAKADIKAPKLPADLLRTRDRQVGYNNVDTPESVKELLIREMQAVTGIDLLVGRITKELKKQGIADNTIIIFSADHGLFKGQFGLGGKALCYEQCTKVPLIIYDPRAPKKLRGVNNDELVLLLDLAPTILDFAKVEAPETYQGSSLVPMVDEGEGAVREYLFTENLWSTPFGNPRCESVQDKEWKYIRYYKNENPSATDDIKALKELGIKPNVLYRIGYTEVLTYRKFVNAPLEGEKPVYEELYNLKNDPKETTNLISNNYLAPVLEKMRTECDKALRYARGTGAPRVDIVVKDYDPKSIKINKKPALKK